MHLFQSPIPSRFTRGSAWLWALALSLVLSGASPALAQDGSGEGGSDEDGAGEDGTNEDGVQSLPPAPLNDYYGVNFISPQEPWLTLAKESGTGIVRWQFNWRDHEITPGEWRWTDSDQIVHAWNEAGIGIHAIMHTPPDFALANPPNGLVPTNIDLPWDHPDNGWGHYCYNFAERYRGQIASYEIWNEPDLTQYWEGSSREYFYVLRSCYTAIKAADPDVPVSMAGMALLVNPNFYPQVVNYAANDADAVANNYYFDAVSIHLYAAPHLAYTLTLQARSVLEGYGLGSKPIWITEAGVALRGYGIAPDEAQWNYVTEEEAGWFAIQMVANAVAAGAERVMWFRLADDGMSEAFGLVRSDGTRRPAYFAWQTATSLMHDIVEVQRLANDGIVRIEMRRADGARIIVLYTEPGVGRNVTFQAEAPAAVVINSSGGYTTAVPDENGWYQLYIPEARGRDFEELYNYTVGGPPLIVLESDNQPPTAAIEAVPIEDDLHHILLRWGGDDGELGTGIANYDIEFSVDNGRSWEAWQSSTEDTEGIFEVDEDGRYLFRVRALDHSGNLGAFSEHTEFVNRLVGTLIVQVIDLRGQRIPYARAELSDGSLVDGDENGWLTLELEPGTAQVRGVDGSLQGHVVPPPVEIELGTEQKTTWMLLPRENLIPNGTFDSGLEDWKRSFTGDVDTARTDSDEQNRVLRLNGYRRPWGSPSAAVTVNVPPEMSDGVLSFTYRLTERGGQMLRLRAITAGGQALLWQTNAISPEFNRVWIDMAAYAGQQVTLVFDLWGPKGTAPASIEIDDVIFGNVPVLAGQEAGGE